MGTEISKETGLTILSPNVLSAWGAIGSVTQWLQVEPYLERLPELMVRIGRKWSMTSYWVIIAAGVAVESAANNWKVWVSTASYYHVPP
jgi:hypothetical protein